MTGKPKDPTNLNKLLSQAVEALDSMTPEQQREMHRRQAEGVARAEASWPKPRYRMVDGVKVYESYEDYCNG